MLKQINALGTEKTIASNTDIIPIQQANGVTCHMTRQNFLANISTTQEFPTSFARFQDESKIINGTSITPEYSSSYPFGSNFYVNPGAINNSFEFNQLLASGTYTLSILYQKGGNRGDLKLEINGVLAFSDLIGYQSSFGFLTVNKTITILSSGIQNFKFTIFQKQASSSGYGCGITRFSAVKV